MPYCRRSDDSDLYMYGGMTAPPGVPGVISRHSVVCCGCLFNTERVKNPELDKTLPAELRCAAPPDGLDWMKYPDPEFTSRRNALAHIEAHETAGHRIPADLKDMIRQDYWLEEE